ncbi:hypothetical protein [Streptomyces sp. NPDC101393]|uniref:hypothetical protein n=1 Tax=Streptomyces sp. NPDC101393 TaxID=3366141 RepID=UPI003827238B
MVIDPLARSTDGESVRIAKDVLCAAVGAKICLPDGPEEFGRALAKRGHRRPVVIGDDRALLRVVGLLHKERELGRAPVSMVPVGAPAAVALSRALGVPTDTVAAARAVLDGDEQPMDLLTDDSDGIVLGGLRIPCGGDTTGSGYPQGPPPGGGADRRSVPAGSPGEGGAAADGDAHRHWWEPAARTARTALSLLATPAGGLGGRRGQPPVQRLRIEADGIVLADLDRPVRRVSVVPAGQTEAARAACAAGDALPSGAEGLAEVIVHWPGSERPVRARARAVTVSGPDFHYRADAVVGGPVRTRTWTVQPGAWWLTLPRR